MDAAGRSAWGGRLSSRSGRAKSNEFAGSNARRLRARRARMFLARRRNRIYVWREKAATLLSPGNDLKILFPVKPEWMQEILGGFRRTRYEIKFASLADAQLTAFDVVVPLQPEDFELLRKCPEILRKNKIPIPSDECVRLCNDKAELCQFLNRAGFEAFIPKLGPGLTPPYILKKRVGCWGQDCYVVHDAKDEQALSQELNDPAYFCQELVPGTREFATHILFLNGRIVKALNIMYEFETETAVKGQTPWLYRGIHRCPYLKLFTRILQTIGFEGLCCLNYKVAGDKPFLLEINPRFGGSLSPYFFSFLRHVR